MNLLSPEDFNTPNRSDSGGGVSNTSRRRSFCNGIIWDTVKNTQQKKNKRERRGSLTEPAANAPCRRSSIVHRSCICTLY